MTKGVDQRQARPGGRKHTPGCEKLDRSAVGHLVGVGGAEGFGHGLGFDFLMRAFLMLFIRSVPRSPATLLPVVLYVLIALSDQLLRILLS